MIASVDDGLLIGTDGSTRVFVPCYYRPAVPQSRRQPSRTNVQARREHYRLPARAAAPPIRGSECRRPAPSSAPLVRHTARYAPVRNRSPASSHATNSRDKRPRLKSAVEAKKEEAPPAKRTNRTGPEKDCAKVVQHLPTASEIDGEWMDRTVLTLETDCANLKARLKETIDGATAFCSQWRAAMQESEAMLARLADLSTQVEAHSKIVTDIKDTIFPPASTV